MSSVTTSIHESGDIDKLLGALPLAMRDTALMAAVRASLVPMRDRTRALAPMGGPRTGRKSGKKHLGATVTLATRDYGAVKVGLVGAAYPEGAHAHLIEQGHDVVRDGKVVGRAAPQPFMRPAAEQTKTQQQAAFTGELSKRIAEVS